MPAIILDCDWHFMIRLFVWIALHYHASEDYVYKTCGANVEQINTLYKSENLASCLLSASCEIFYDFKKYPEPEHNRLKERKEKEKK